MSTGKPRPIHLVLAFAAIYLIWGSTYLAIRFAIETLPGFFMTGVRFVVAGGILYIWARLRRGAVRPGWSQWRSALIIGTLLFGGGVGSVVWAEQRVVSGLAALLVAVEPLWVVLLLWLWPGGRAPRRRTVSGIVLGILGVALLVLPGHLHGAGGVHLLSAGVILLASLWWALGSLYARTAALPETPSMSSAIQMLCGGVFLLLVAAFTGEFAAVDVAVISAKSVLAMAYLTLFGAVIAYVAYYWLVRVVRPALVSTYAYVNPVAAVFLGWLLAGEPLTLSTLIASALIIGAVVIISLDGSDR